MNVHCPKCGSSYFKAVCSTSLEHTTDSKSDNKVITTCRCLTCNEIFYITNMAELKEKEKTKGE